MSRQPRVGRMLHLQGLLSQAPSLGGGPPKPVLFFINANVAPHFTSGVRAVGLNLGPMMIERCGYDVGAIAGHLLERLRLLQPVGPYLLGGHCFGGVVAFEVARLLEEAGETVDRLFLVETPHMATLDRLEFVRKVLLCLANPDLLAGFLARRLSAALRLRRRPEPGADDPYRRKFLSATSRTASCFVTRPYRGRIVLFFGRRSRYRFLPSSGWRRTAAAGLDIHVIPGTHYIDDLLSRGGLAERISGMILNGNRTSPPGATGPR